MLSLIAKVKRFVSKSRTGVRLEGPNSLLSSRVAALAVPCSNRLGYLTLISPVCDAEHELVEDAAQVLHDNWALGDAP